MSEQRDNLEVKAHVERSLPPHHPARAVFGGLPDRMGTREWDAALPFLVRVLRVRAGEGLP